MVKRIALCLSLMFFSMSAVAQIVPLVNDDPRTDQVLDRDMFDFVAKTLGSGKMASHMACTLKTRIGRDLRTFSTGSEWVEYLEVDYNSSGFASGQKVAFKIPMGAKYGISKTTNQWSAIGEDIKIELGDRDGYWIRFVHDGQGRIVMLQLGSDLRLAPCARLN
mgnify:CR=1 FL=1